MLIYHWKERLTLAQLAEAIKQMREYIRSQEKDIRLNSRTHKYLTEFIVKLKPKKLKPDGGKPIAAKAVPGSSKRKRDDSDESSDEGESEEEVVQSLAKRTRSSTTAAATKQSPPSNTPKITKTTKAPPSKVKSSSSSEPQTPSIPLPRGPAPSQSAPTIANATPSGSSTSDPRRRAAEIAPKVEPSSTLMGGPNLFAPSPPPQPQNWPNPYPTPQVQTPSPNPAAWAPTQNSLFSNDRLAALRAAKEHSLGGGPPNQFWQGNAGPFTPPPSQPGSQPTAPGVARGLGDSLMSRMSFDPQGYSQQNGAGWGQGGFPPPG